MKRILRRSSLIFAVTLAFIGGMGYLSYQLIANAGDWVDQPFNAHVSGSGGLEQAGKILDRNNTILAQTVDGKRVYNDSQSVRKSLLHVVGDDGLNISTAAQSMYRSQMTGYSLVWGLNMPQSMRTSRDIKLTVDAQASAAAYDVLSAYDKKGACVVYNYKTGEVICSTSTLAYDPQAPPEITEENESQYDGVYLDNVLSSSYAPGSTFKIITAAAAIESIPDLDSRTWYCEGKKEIGGDTITCVEPHGQIDFKGAMGHSCNIAFAELAIEVGKEKMTSTAEKAGINHSFNIEGVGTAKGSYDVTKANENELGWSGVGQYNDRANPMQMAIICGAIANGGKSVTPHFIADETKGLLDFSFEKSEEGRECFSSSTAAKLDEVLRNTVASYYGDYMFGNLTVCAKTGTAEVGNGKEATAWMVGYTQDESCPLAFACVIEEAGFGFSYAGPVVQAALLASAKNYGY